MFVLLLQACLPNETPSSDFSFTGVTEEMVEVALVGWEDFTPYTDTIEASSASSDTWFEVLLNEDAALWVDDQGFAEENISIVRPVYNAQDSDEMTALTIMFKVPGSSPETDDWQWAKADPEGSVLEYGAETTASCSSCHTVTRDTNHWLLAVNL